MHATVNRPLWQIGHVLYCSGYHVLGGLFHWGIRCYRCCHSQSSCLSPLSAPLTDLVTLSNDSLWLGCTHWLPFSLPYSWLVRVSWESWSISLWRSVVMIKRYHCAQFWRCLYRMMWLANARYYRQVPTHHTYVSRKIFFISLFNGPTEIWTMGTFHLRNAHSKWSRRLLPEWLGPRFLGRYRLPHHRDYPGNVVQHNGIRVLPSNAGSDVRGERFPCTVQPDAWRVSATL